MKFDWNRARAFLVTAEEGSLSAAAKSLGVSQTTLGRQVSALEDELSVVLFERGGRGLELTHSGLELLSYVKGMGEAARSLSLAASGRVTSVEGDITISASEITATYVLPTILRKIQQQYPGIVLNLVASNETSDLRRQDADIAIRHFRPTEPDLITRKIGQFSASLYANPEILTGQGTSISCDDSSFRFIGSISNNITYRTALANLGLEVPEEKFVARTDNHLAHLELTKTGVGIGMLPTEIADSEPDLVKVFDHVLFVGDVWLVSHQELRMNLRVRKVFDMIYHELAEYYKN